MKDYSSNVFRVNKKQREVPADNFYNANKFSVSANSAEETSARESKFVESPMKNRFGNEIMKYKHAVRCYCADADYGRSVSDSLGLNFERVKRIAKNNFNTYLDASC